ncbi:MAG: ABC transporter ATP-binding protein [Ardenticatenaceae bacterium]|nr:ABC transporter ATP-binding protein [Ardenticatenaceae bacterium]
MPPRLIRLHAVTKRYRMGDRWVDALRGISLAIAPGEFVALIGASGSGKSTLLHLVGGLDRPTTGEVWVDGTNLGQASEAALTAHRRARVGFIFQRFELLPRLSAWENVAAPLMFAGTAPAERRARAETLLAQVGLATRADHLPSQLSGGEQQRVAIARALVNRPAILLADEPTGNLDSATGAEIMALLNQLNREQGVTLLAVTHDPEVAAFARRVVRLKDGQIINDTLDGMPVEKLQVEG